VGALIGCMLSRNYGVFVFMRFLMGAASTVIWTGQFTFHYLYKLAGLNVGNQADMGVSWTRSNVSV
jgi:hypothetical protein